MSDETPTADRPHALYRFYAADGALLYVGITADPGNRWRQHAEGKPWWHEVRGISLETFASRSEVLAAEKRAIAVENPRHNIIRPSIRRHGPEPRPSPKRALRHLVWICRECGQPVANGKGYIHVSVAKIREVRDSDARYEAQRQERLAAGIFFEDLSEICERISNGEAQAHWQVHHRECDPEPDAADYWFGVERARTHAQLLDWSAHWMRKSWLPFTDWPELIQRMAAVDA